jgi:uncharacterized LabA/DUF88 family protein
MATNPITPCEVHYRIVERAVVESAAMSGCLILVDNSNIFIEGQKYSAKLKGVVRGHPDEKDPCDPSWRINFGSLLAYLADGRKILDALLVGSRPPQNDTVWEAAKQNGFSVAVFNRSGREEKAVDTELVARGTEIICSTAEPGSLVLASGDRDFLPLVNVAHRKKWEVEMCAFSSAFRTDGEMALAVEKVRPMDAYYLKVGRHDFVWPIPALGE